jgi:hypothetical protein
MEIFAAGCKALNITIQSNAKASLVDEHPEIEDPVIASSMKTFFFKAV